MLTYMILTSAGQIGGLTRQLQAAQGALRGLGGRTCGAVMERDEVRAHKGRRRFKVRVVGETDIDVGAALAAYNAYGGDYYMLAGDA